jgi:hypothetical protein
MNKILITTCIGSCALAAACGAPLESDQFDGLEDVGKVQERVVSGATRVSVGNSTSEAEAVIAITGSATEIHTIVTANADSPSSVFYSDGGTPNTIADDTRTVHPGASLMTIWHRTGLSGSYTTQRMTPPERGALWGDPAIAASGQFVYATSLRIPLGNFPLNSIGAPRPIVNTGGSSIGDFLAGACVARSSDFGQNFTMDAARDCASDEGHFYDGSAVTTTADGKLFAAFNDVDMSEIDVWRSDSPTGAIFQTPNPFPHKNMFSHPRMVFSRVPHLMAVDEFGQLWMSRYVSGVWGTPIPIASNVAFHQPVTLRGGMTLRQANGFDFTVYQAPNGSGPVVEYVIMQLTPSNKTILRVGRCAAPQGTWSCQTDPEWVTNPDVNSFMPAIASGGFPRQGFIERLTKITFHRDNGDGIRVALHAATAFEGPLAATRITGWQTPCPDLRGYWGDYDSMVAASDGFHRVFSDSTESSPCIRQGYTQQPLGVSEAVIPAN